MSFNSDPAKSAEKIIFTNRNSTSYDTLTYSGVDVEPVDDNKYLCFVLDSKLSSNNHMYGKIAKANQGMGMIRPLYTYLLGKNPLYGLIWIIVILFIIRQHTMISIEITTLKEPELTQGTQISILLTKLKLSSIMLR